jgi:translation initiation factor IF-2
LSKEKKEIKINIKNTQIAEALQLDKLKQKLAGKKAEAVEDISKTSKASAAKTAVKPLKGEEEQKQEEAPRRKARTRSAFAKEEETIEEISVTKEIPQPEVIQEVEEEVVVVSAPPPPPEPEPIVEPKPIVEQKPIVVALEEPKPKTVERVVLGPTGRHVKDLYQRPAPVVKAKPPVKEEVAPVEAKKEEDKDAAKKDKPKSRPGEVKPVTQQEADANKNKAAKFKEFSDVKPAKKTSSRFDTRDRYGLRDTDDDQRWRKKRAAKQTKQEEATSRPTSIAVRLPIRIKDLAVSMKLKSSELISKLFLQGVIVTINDFLEDETTVQLIGSDFGCNITIDTTEEERIRITDKTIREEISTSDTDKLITRAPVVTFMGHVDHGKTSLIDYIRQSSVASGEAGAITQHIGAFRCKTAVGDIAILDTPGHEAFSAMRARGADVTDIVVLVVAGDEGMRAQTEEAMNHAIAAGVTIVVAINKCDKPNFNPENVYRQLAEKNLLPEAWGGQTITVNTSAKTGEGIKGLLEMLAVQAEVLELKANTQSRARGTVLESELHKGMGSVATVLVQNGTLKIGDALVFGQHWGRVKTMQDEHKKDLLEAGPSTPVEITGLSGLPEAGEEFIAVANEMTAREIAEQRSFDKRHLSHQPKKISLESMLQQATDSKKKMLNIILRADVQGSLEALKAALLRIQSEKVDISIISAAVGEVSESDVLLGAASKAIIIGFHTVVESHAEQLVKQHGVRVFLHDIIYHAVDEVKEIMTGLLDRIAQEDLQGKATVLAVFKSSQHGRIAGCMISEGTIHRNNHVRIIREGQIFWKGSISSLRRDKEDVREVSKGFECGILLNNFNDIKDNDIIEAYETTYLTQTL